MRDLVAGIVALLLLLIVELALAAPATVSRNAAPLPERPCRCGVRGARIWLA
jgi:hypothetical protein